MYKGCVCELGGGLYTNCSTRFQRGTVLGISRTIKANSIDAAVVVEISNNKYERIKQFYESKKDDT